MAQRVVQNVENDYLICSICLGRYTDPRLLPCGHTFCRQCLADHIQQTVLNLQAHHFTCPIDRGNVPRPGPNIHPREWANTFPEDSFLSSLLQAVRSYEQGGPPVAIPVPPSGRRNAFQRGSQQRQRNDQQQRQQASPPPPPQHDSDGITCVEHPGRTLEFFCMGCCVLVCAHCAVRSHRTPRCECISHEEALTRLRPRLEELTVKFQNQMLQIEDISRNGLPFDLALENSKARAMDHLTEAESKVSAFTQNCIQNIENLKRDVRGVGLDLPTEDENMSSLLRRIQGTKESFENVFNANAGPDLLSSLPRLQSQADTYETEIQRATTDNATPRLELTTNASFQNFLRNPPSVAILKINRTPQVQDRTPRVQNQTSRDQNGAQTVRREGTFSVRPGRNSRTNRHQRNRRVPTGLIRPTAD